MLPRSIPVLLIAALSLLVPSAFAQGAALERVVIGEALQEKEDEYGARDLRRLREDLREAVSEALARDGLLAGNDAGDLVITLTLEDAWPNRPTFAQMSDQPGLSYRSVSRGGARLSAVIETADGRQVGGADYEWRTFDIADSAHRSTWTDAKRTFERFAGRLAEEVESARTAG